VNILRDLPRDLRQGRCYVPRARLEQNALTPQDLLDPAASARFRSLYQTYLDRADEHLEAGWAYVRALPRCQMRVRLACLWPLLIGRRTLELLRAGDVLRDGPPIKVSRSEVRRLMLSSLGYLWKK
jgi:farnesyl-diphosphate farnesyltransferase